MSLFLSLLLHFFSFFFFISNAAELGRSSKNCPAYSCGDVLIGYPFWLLNDNTTSQFCGYKGFGINCSSDQNRPIMNLDGDSYYVQGINYDDQNLTLVDIDATTGGDCPRMRHDISLGDLPLNFSASNVNISFHFNCSEVPTFVSLIQCLESQGNQSYVNIVDKELENFRWHAFNCTEEVVTKVTGIAETVLGLSWQEFRRALRGGFELNWLQMENCSSCEESGGWCGHKFLTWDRWEVMCFCPDGSNTTDHCKIGNRIHLRLRLVIGLGAAGFSIFIMCCIHHTVMKSRIKSNRNVEAFIMEYGSLTPKRYRYSEIKKMTQSFRVKLGQGGFGSVFKGKLSDGRLVAVKVLNSSKGNSEEFVNEVASIGRTSHVNIVTLLGFCYEGQRSALIYEFMPNGSLERFIHRDVPPGTGQQLGVRKLYEIALGIARGLEYLHCGCNTRILHLDIKPHNILLDEDFCPKISDFGLAKLYSRKESIISMLEARGTVGYIAPEVFMRNFGRVSHKSDVYSYGMMILEMVGGKKVVDAGIDHSSNIYFPHWIYKNLVEDDLKLDGLETGEEKEIARKMILIGLWCIQTDPSQRPSMNKVIELLEGSTEAIQAPPKPFLSSHQSPETFATSDSKSM